MKEKIIFREMLSEIKTLADKKGNYITKDEIKDFFKNAHLEEEKLALIYEYLAGQKIKIEGYQSAKADVLEAQTLKEAKSDDDDTFAAMYLKDLENVASVSEDEEFQLFERAVSGDDLAKAQLTELHLRTVYELSRNYSGGKISQGDILQEGNVGLLLAVNQLQRKQCLKEYRDFLLEEIQNAMKAAVEEQETMLDMDEEMVTRVNYLNEAVRNLELDMEQKVSIDELSAYLEMPIEEIKDILRMAGDEIEVEGEIYPEPHSHDHGGF